MPARRAAEREGALQHVTFRTTAALRAKLEGSASKAGRSLTQEIERRLELSLAQEDYLRRTWGEDVFSIAEAIARSIHIIEDVYGPWLEHEEAYELVRITVSELVRRYHDSHHGHSRDFPRGSLEGKSQQELAEMFAALGGLRPPRPRTPSPVPADEREGKGAAVINMLEVLRQERMHANEPKPVRKSPRRRKKE